VALALTSVAPAAALSRMMSRAVCFALLESGASEHQRSSDFAAGMSASRKIASRVVQMLAYSSLAS
jgi:hypothetical protein